MNMITQVTSFVAYYVRGKIKVDSLENVITFESREQFSTR